MDTMDKNIQVLYEKIKKARHCVALTGAGISTLSGIRDFRGKNGIYNDMDASKMFDIDYFEEDPSYYYKTAGSFIYNLDEKEPSVVHIVLGLLEKKGWLKAVITQNIDLLHQKGGSKNVIEVHGSPSVHYCLRCSGVRVSYDAVVAVIKQGKLPTCPQCGRVLKPAITFFGESLPFGALRDAETNAQKADLMLVLGTSLTVNPAAGIPQTVVRNNGEVVIVNNMPTYLDSHAALHFHDLAEVFDPIRAWLAE
ncbi:Sir2 family NAD-dependent protein deacetylase [Breznakiellaceae bacterium SP9]